MKVGIWLLAALIVSVVLGLWMSSSTPFTSRSRAVEEANSTSKAHINAPLTETPSHTRSRSPDSLSDIATPETANSGHLRPAFQGDLGASRDTTIGKPAQAAQRADSKFRMSESVISNCLKRNSGVCDDQVVDMIDRLVIEERDVAWASEAETRLRLLSVTTNRENVVRQCFCGSTICALEIASKEGRFGGYLDSDAWLNSQLELWDGIYGYEGGDDGSRITVSLKVYRRR